MNRKSLFEKILDKWPYKITCLVIAIFLYIFHEASLVTKKTYIVPLTISENGLVMHVDDAPSSVSVIIRSSEENIKSIQVSDITAVANVDYVTEEGVVKIPVTLKIADSVMEMEPLEVRLAEEYVTLRVEEKTLKYVPITPVVIGTPAHGYYVENVSVEPSVVAMTGPSSIVNAIESIQTSRINVSNAETSFSVTTGINQIESIVSILDESPYSATVTVSPESMEKTFSDVVPVVTNLSSSLVLEQNLAGIEIVLSGFVPALENYTLPQRSVSVNLAEYSEPGTYTVPVRFNIPSSFEIISTSADSVSVVLKEKPSEIKEESEPADE